MLESWALATSPAPYGLGMTSQESWDLTPREFREREKVRRAYMASWLCEIRNAPHFHRQDKQPWTESSLFERSEPESIASHTVSLPERTPEQKQSDEAVLALAKVQLTMISSRPDLVPEWAKGPYFGPPQRGS